MVGLAAILLLATCWVESVHATGGDYEARCTELRADPEMQSTAAQLYALNCSSVLLAQCEARFVVCMGAASLQEDPCRNMSYHCIIGRMQCFEREIWSIANATNGDFNVTDLANCSQAEDVRSSLEYVVTGGSYIASHLRRSCQNMLCNTYEQVNASNCTYEGDIICLHIALGFEDEEWLNPTVAPTSVPPVTTEVTTELPTTTEVPVTTMPSTTVQTTTYTTAEPTTALAPTSEPTTIAATTTAYQTTPVPTTSCPLSPPFSCNATSQMCSLVTPSCKCSDAGVLPAVMLDIASPVRLYTTEELRVTATAFYTTCAERSNFLSGFQYSWLIRRDAFQRASSGASLYIPPLSENLLPGQTYDVVATATHTASSMQGSSSFSLQMLSPVIKLSFIGGARQLSWTYPLELTVTTNDPYQSDGSPVRWSCCRATSVGVCINVCEGSFSDLTNYHYFTLTISTVAPLPVGYFIFFASYKTADPASVFVSILSRSDVPEVLISAPTDSLRYDRSITVSAAVKRSNITQYRWSVNGTLYKTDGTTKCVTFPPGLFPPNAPVTIGVNVTSSLGNVGSGTIVLFPTSPMVQGKCHVEPLVAGSDIIACSSRIVITVEGWKGAASTIQYRYGFVSSDGAEVFLTQSFALSSRVVVTAPALSRFVTEGERALKVTFFVDAATSSDVHGGKVYCDATLMSYVMQKSQREALRDALGQMAASSADHQQSAVLTNAYTSLTLVQSLSSEEARSVVIAVVGNASQVSVNATTMSRTERSSFVELLAYVSNISTGMSLPSTTKNQMITILQRVVAEAALENENLDLDRDGSEVMAQLTWMGKYSPVQVLAALQTLAVQAASTGIVGSSYSMAAAPSTSTLTSTTVSGVNNFLFDVPGVAVCVNSTFRLSSGIVLPSATLSQYAVINLMCIEHSMRLVQQATYAYLDLVSTPVAAHHLFHVLDANSTVAPRVGDAFVLLDETVTTWMIAESTDVDVSDLFAQDGLASLTMNISVSLALMEASLQSEDSPLSKNFPMLTDLSQLKFACAQYNRSGRWSDVGITTLSTTSDVLRERVVRCSVRALGNYSVLTAIPTVSAAPTTPTTTVVASNRTYAPVPEIHTSDSNALQSLTIALGSLAGIIVVLLLVLAVGVWQKPMAYLAKLRGASNKGGDAAALEHDSPLLHAAGDATNSLAVPQVSTILASPQTNAERMRELYENGTQLQRVGSNVHRLVIDEELQLLVSLNGTKRLVAAPNAEDPTPWL